MATTATAESKVIVSAQVTAYERRELERRAEAGTRTLSQEVRRALQQYLAERKKER
jgi:hypothetical protein